MFEKISPYWKAVVAFAAPAAVTLTSAVTEPSAGGVAITTGEWVTAISACFITAAVVYATPNKDSNYEPERAIPTPEEG